MAELSTEDLRLRQFLLGKLDEKEREEMEQLVLSEGNTRDKLLMAEDDLIEEYLEGSLQGEDREKFLLEFLSIPHQRNKLRIAKSLRRFARNEANIDTVPIQPRRFTDANMDTEPIQPRRLSEADIETVPIHPEIFQSQGLPFYRNPLVYAPMAVLVVVAITAGAIWYAQYRSTIAREHRRQEVERELARLNGSAEPNLPADQISTLIVAPFSPRSVVASSASSLHRPVLELWLIPSSRQSGRYDASLQKVGSDEKFQIPNLELRDRGGDKAVRLRIPTRLLTPGAYRVQLSDTSEYNFEIQ